MVSPSTTDLPIPKSWDEFEELIWDLFKRKWEEISTERYGRSGQAQQGVDIYGQPKGVGGDYAGIQCKRYGIGGLTKTIIKREIRKAEDFEPKLALFIVATTDKRNAKLQKEIRLINREREEAEKFQIKIMFWEDLSNEIVAHNDILRKHYGGWREVFRGEETEYKIPFMVERLPENFAERPGPG